MSTDLITKRPSLYFAVASVALLFFSCMVAMGQTITGDITGAVVDPSGAIIPGATVTATNVDTNVKVSTVSNNSGIYSIRFLQIGQYQVTVAVKGFQTQVYGPFTLEQGQTAKVDAKMVVGAPSTTVKVTGALAPLLNTEDSSTSTTLDANAIENITNKGRNFSLFTALVPGAIDTSPQQLSGSFATERDTSQVSEIGANGNRAQSNNYMLDGVEINETIGNLIGYSPNIDALDEVKVVSATPSAEYGNSNGMTVLAVTKSGSNTPHGQASYYLENYNLDANSWTNKNHVAGQVIPINPYTQNIFSGSFGGPVVIPHFFNGRNKLFFFADYEGTRFQSGGSGSASVLSVAERNGDFSELFNPNIMCGANTCSDTKLYQLYNATSNPTTFTPYNNNQITITSPIALYLIAHPAVYPLPNATPSTGSPNSNNYTGPTFSSNRNDQGDVKIDWTPTQKDRISFRYLQGEGSDLGKNVLLINFVTPGDYPVKGFTVSSVHTFNPKLVNEFRCCFFRTRYTNSQPLDLTGLFGITGNATVGIPGKQLVPGFSQQNFPSGSGSLGTFGTLGGGTDEVENIFNYSDNLTYQRGKHLFKMGVQFERYQQNYSVSSGGALGSFGFTGAYTSNPNNAGGSATVDNSNGWGAADWVLDRVNTEGYGGETGKVGQRQWRDAYFFQDDWKILPHLTLNMGVRYQYDQPVYEVNNKEANPQPNYTTGIATILLAGVNGASRALYNPTYHDILPRFGIEYQVTRRIVVSTGYGMVSEMEGTGTADRLTQNPPFQYNVTVQATPPTKTSAGSYFQETSGFTNGGTSSGVGYFSYDTHLQPEIVQNYNLTVQYELSNTTLLKVAYVGEKGDHLIGEYRGNELQTPCYINNVLQPVSNAACGAVDPGPFYSLVGENGSVITTNSEGIMEYDAAQVQFRQMVWNGLEFTANYAFGRAMTDTTGFQAVAAVNGTGVAQENAYDAALNWGPAGQDEKHSLNANMVYQLPFGRGKLLFGNVNRAVDEAINGWKVSMVYLGYTGFPNTPSAITQNIQTYYNGAPQQRPNKVGNLPNLARYAVTGGVFWYGPQTTGTSGTIATAYTDPAATNPIAFGNAKVGDLRGPDYVSVDFSLFKDFTLFRNNKLGFEVDAYNATNTNNLGNPTTSIGSASFGEITSVRGKERTVQIATKYQF